MSRIRANQITNQSADGAPTVQNGLVISGVTTSTNVSVASSVTATTYYGSGASLTNLNASAIASGTVPTARLGSGTASSSTFLAGDSTYKTVTGTTINNNADNRLITGSGTANTLEGESNITVDSSRLFIRAGSGSGLSSNADDLVIGANDDSTARGITIASTTNGNIRFMDGSDSSTGMIEYNHSSNFMRLYVEQGEALRIDSSRRVLIGTTTEGFATYGDKLTIANSGHCGMTIRSGTSSYGTIYFSDGDAGGAEEVRGFIDYNHSNNQLQLGANAATRLRISSDGYVTMPNQPSFSASRSSGHVYGGNPPTDMVFNSVDFNVGNNYNNSNGIFTAPIAGKYQFSFSGMAAGGTADFQVRILKNGGGFFNSNGSGRGYGTFEPYGFTVLIDLAINDTVQIKIYSSNTSCYIYAGGIWNKFSGRLVA